MTSRQSVGIDLGTTHTVVAHVGRPLAPRRAEPLVPSVVAFPPSQDGGAIEPLVGRRARLRRPIDAANVIASSKRLIGEPWNATRAEQLQSFYVPELVESPVRRIGLRTRAGVHDPVEIAERILTYACGRVGVRPEENEAAVVTVPSAFGARQRSAVFQAIREVGFDRVGIVEEPVATAIAYLQRSSLRYAAVYDFGGGTFDVTVVDCARYPFDVVAHGGDPFLGGDDVDRALAEQVAQQTLEATGWDLRSERGTFDRLISACEWAKRAMAEHERVGIPLTEIDPAAPADIPPAPIDRELVQRIAEPFIRRTFIYCDEVLDRGSIKARDVDAVFLAGGSSHLVGLKHHVQAYFGKRPRSDLDPLHVVAVGASYAAARPDFQKLLDVPVGRRRSRSSPRMTPIA
ncbi:MAG TPA: Hsp70 family protein [Polyangiaceae bacterium LLY-WYZ-15_(1-7)]|nr:hypothetical protein [Myxococcales bacterium]MAT27389.1 hypothetical protein [Sandaracinus sp.]HJK90165.1 Hsp70 family protein [Polyangiaceae bacterium LLY-WYZ-15_(1-7)]MBJ72475.1 hypothetical protein [Sandaracinus sp.]HJL04838.1 Hsp70 family protein [Polyangiaceae bacterium LLY-WYZ-15_(1-7)]